MGDWTLMRTKEKVGMDEVVLWHGPSADVAIELIGSSNGWWHLRRGTLEDVVWSEGSASKQEFYWRPWETPLAKSASGVAIASRERPRRLTKPSYLIQLCGKKLGKALSVFLT